ncbi:uncharacterized protein LOC142334522 [Convolutriloba macropyga]|uniref:uncharacterized protein LOC142334522 n=1 Tax=Convolutriloba macropyga TaxID=536237 RepID=UPI003F520A10
MNRNNVGNRGLGLDNYLMTCLQWKTAPQTKLKTLCVIDRLPSPDYKGEMVKQKTPTRVATLSRQQIAVAELEAVAKLEPRLKHYLTVNQKSCQCRPDCLPKNAIKSEQIPPIVVPQSYYNPKYNVPKERPLRHPQVLTGWPNVDHKGQQPVPASVLDMHRQYDRNYLDMSQFNWKCTGSSIVPTSTEKSIKQHGK